MYRPISHSEQPFFWLPQRTRNEPDLAHASMGVVVDFWPNDRPAVTPIMIIDKAEAKIESRKDRGERRNDIRVERCRIKPSQDGLDRSDIR